MKNDTEHITASLLVDFQSGNRDALHTLYLQHYRPLWHFANGLLNDATQAEDFVAESFVKCWQKRAEFESLKSIHNFLFIVTRNACLSYIKQRNRQQLSRRELLYLSTNQEDMEDAHRVRQELVMLALKESECLPPKMKKVFRLIYQEGFSTGEVARALNLSVNTISTQKKNAILRVKEGMLKKGLITLLILIAGLLH